MRLDVNITSEQQAAVAGAAASLSAGSVGVATTDEDQVTLIGNAIKKTNNNLGGGSGAPKRRSNDKALALVSSSRGSASEHQKGAGSSVLGRPGAMGGPSKAYLASDNERHKRKLAKARERRATLILGLIMAAFICSWFPFFFFYVLRAVCHVCRDYIPPRLEAFIFWMGYCNSAINPIIYTIFNRDFRKAFRKILFRCSRD